MILLAIFEILLGIAVTVAAFSILATVGPIYLIFILAGGWMVGNGIGKVSNAL